MNAAETAVTVGYSQAAAGMGMTPGFTQAAAGMGEYFWGDASPGDSRDGIFTTFAGLGAIDAKQKKMLIWGGVGAALLLGIGIVAMKRRRH